MDPEIQVCPTLGDAELNALFRAAWPGHVPRSFAPVLARSLCYVAAFRDGRLAGFANVAWDGGAHAFLLDPTVHPEHRRRGLGLALVRRATEEARAAGAEWLHVDFEPRLAPFYEAAGFRPTRAGLIHLAGQGADRRDWGWCWGIVDTARHGRRSAAFRPACRPANTLPSTPDLADMNRPTGFTVVALILGYLTFAGLANAVGAAAMPDDLLAFGLQPAVIVVSALAYAATAGLTAAGLWRGAPWSGRAAAAWALACDAGALAFLFMTGRAGLWPPMPLPIFLAAIVFFLCLPWLLVLYVSRRLRTWMLDGA